uniref:Uncharacterized protein n=1 Tax=Arundo donax TaxID=35708 RepID=A0A0A9FBC0_ARUDO
MSSRGTGTPGRSRGDIGRPGRSRGDKGKATMLQYDPNESEIEKYHASETVSQPRTSSLPPSPPYRAIGMYGTARHLADQSMPLQKNEVLHSGGVGRSEDDENMNNVGKGNVDKWLHMLMDNQQEEGLDAHHSSEEQNYDEVNASDEQHMQSRIDEESYRNDITECSDEIVEVGDEIAATDQGTARCRNSIDIKEREDRKIWFPRTDSARGFRSLPSSPSKILGMRRGVDCIGRKPKVTGDEDSVSTSSSKFLSRCKQAIKKAVNK